MRHFFELSVFNDKTQKWYVIDKVGSLKKAELKASVIEKTDMFSQRTPHQLRRYVVIEQV